MSFSYWDDFENRKFNRDLMSCQCGCSHHNHNGNHSHHQDSFDHGHFKDDCGCKKDDRRLNRLELSLAQRLRTLVDSFVSIELLSNEEDEIIEGTLCFVGGDFVDVCIGKRRKRNVRTIPFHAIKTIREILPEPCEEDM